MASNVSHPEFGAQTTGTEAAGAFAGRIGGKVGEYFGGFVCLFVCGVSNDMVRDRVLCWIAMLE